MRLSWWPNHCEDWQITIERPNANKDHCPDLIPSSALSDSSVSG